jgi:hypothetical protein
MTESTKDIVEITKDCFVLIGSLAVALYFYYRLMAGFFILCRLAVELTCEAPFSDKRLVKCVVNLKNTGSASVRIKDARFRVIKLDKSRLLLNTWEWPTWPVAKSEDSSLKIFSRGQLDFQRLSYDGDGVLATYQAGPDHAWLNLEAAGEQQRMFLFNLEEGLYKIEFRIMGTAMFGRDSGITEWLSSKLFSLTRYSQWVATAVIEAMETPVQTKA